MISSQFGKLFRRGGKKGRIEGKGKKRGDKEDIAEKKVLWQ